MLERPISKARWTCVRFDQIATQINDRVDNPAEAGVDRYVGLEHLDPDSLRIRELLARLGGTGPASDETEIAEVIIATDPNTEGEATATYLLRLLRDFPGLSVTRLASGLPMGGDLEFADELTLGRALSGRRAL